jgi:hypothetical protein
MPDAGPRNATKKNADPTHSTPAMMWKVRRKIMMPSLAIT